MIIAQKNYRTRSRPNLGIMSKKGDIGKLFNEILPEISQVYVMI
jgi:hypothetical protein